MGEVAPTRRQVLTVTIVSALAFGVWAATTGFYSLPSNVLSTRDGGQVRKTAVILFPQGWGFFTLAPTTEEYVVYGDRGGHLVSIKKAPQSRPDNLLGLSRKQRAQGPELAALANGVKDWLTCTGGVGPECRERALGETTNAFENNSPVPTICGTVVMVSTKPVEDVPSSVEFRWRSGEHQAALTC